MLRERAVPAMLAGRLADQWQHGVAPFEIIKKALAECLEGDGVIEKTHHAAHRVQLYQHLLDAMASHRVADRPNRFEPRVKKRRLDHYGWLMKPRAEVKRLMAKGVTKI